MQRNENIIEQERVKYQFNNKFVQSIESPRVKGKIRGYITDLLYNTNEPLENCINQNLYTNLLLLEIMFNINSNAFNEENIFTTILIISKKCYQLI